MPVAEAPAFGRKMRPLRLEEGQSAHFESTLTPVNDASMRVEWTRNGKTIPQGHRFRTTYGKESKKINLINVKYNFEEH